MSPNHVTIKHIEKAMGEKGYAFFTNSSRPFNLNIIGIRSNERRSSNRFEDVYTISYMWQGKWHFWSMPCTTDPGVPYLLQPINRAGAAILVPYQMRGAYQIGLHQKRYSALIQRLAVKVYRDNNRDTVLDLDPSTIDVGWHGINHHRAGWTGVTSFINKHSAGCQVLANAADFAILMGLAEKARAYYGNSFTYTLLEEVDIFG